MSTGVEVDGANAIQPARIARRDDLVALPEVGLQHVRMVGGQPLQRPAARRPETAEGEPAVDDHLPHLGGLEMEEGELVEVLREQTAPPQPAHVADDAFTLALALAEPRPAHGGVHGEAVAHILDEAVRGLSLIHI